MLRNRQRCHHRSCDREGHQHDLGRQGQAWLGAMFFCVMLLLPVTTALDPSAPGTGVVNSPRKGGKFFNFTLAFLTALENKGPGKFTAGAFFLAVDELNNITRSKLNDTEDEVFFGYVFRDTHNQETTATRAMVDLFCGDVNVSVFVGPDVFCNSAALLAASFNLPYLSYDCNDIHTLRTNIAKYKMVNFEPSLAYVAKAIVKVMLNFNWKTFYLITGTGNTTNSWADTGHELRKLVRDNGITFQDVTRVELNDKYHLGLKNSKPYRRVIDDSRKRTRVYVFLGDYNALVEFLRDLDSAGITSTGEYVVIAVDGGIVLDADQRPDPRHYFQPLEEYDMPVTSKHLSAFRNVLLLSRLETPRDDIEEFEKQVFARNYKDPINLKRIPDWWPGKKKHDLRVESLHLYDAVMHYGNVVLDLINAGQDPYNADIVTKKMRNRNLESIQGFKVHINEDGESEGGYVLRSLAYRDGRPIVDMWQVASFPFYNGTLHYRSTNNSITWVAGHPPKSEPDCGYDDSLCAGKKSEWKLVAVIISLVVTVLLVIVAVFVGLRYWLILRRMRRQALAATRVGCANSFLELQEQDREGLLVC